MRSHRTVPLFRRLAHSAVVVALLSAACSAAVFAGEPSFHITFDVPDVVGAVGESPVRAEARVLLHTRGILPGEDGANEWTLFVRSSGCHTVEAELSPTVNDLLRRPFVFLDITCECPGGYNGVIASVVLSIVAPISLPPAESPHDLLHVVLEVPPLPRGACRECSLGLVEEDDCGECHLGQPVTNHIGRSGFAFVPTYAERRFYFCSTRFRRGDCNSDGRVNISDAVCILGRLFLGKEEPGCLASADVDGLGSVDISDAIHLLTHLFLGGPAPVPPFAACDVGSLTTDAELGCAAPPRACE